MGKVFGEKGYFCQKIEQAQHRMLAIVQFEENRFHARFTKDIFVFCQRQFIKTQIIYT